MNTLLIPLILAIIVAVVFGVLFLMGRKRLATEQDTARITIDQMRHDLIVETEQRKSAQILLNEQREQTVKLKEELTETLSKELRLAANSVLEERAAKLEEQNHKLEEANREEIGKILNPYKEQLASFEKRINEIHDIEQTQHGSLKSELEQLVKMNISLSKEASDLTNALRGNSKTQGDWGEMILERLLEASGLVCGTHYLVQENLKTETGQNVRPDIIVNLPSEKPLVIDSKVSLTAYTKYVNTDDEQTAKIALSEHVQSVRAHIKELKDKDYSHILKGETPDFVIMFIPNEPAFLEALRADQQLWQQAYESKIIISSPTNLMAVLKIVNDLWKRDDQNRNAIAIAEEGAKMYDKFVGFLDTLEKIGNGINSVSARYDEALKQLSTGSGNLVGRAEKMRKLGIKASKKLPISFADNAELLPEESGEEQM